MPSSLSTRRTPSLLPATEHDSRSMRPSGWTNSLASAHQKARSSGRSLSDCRWVRVPCVRPMAPGLPCVISASDRIRAPRRASRRRCSSPSGVLV